MASIHKQTIPVESKQYTTQVAVIAAANETIGRLIADMMDKVGKDGVITVKGSQETRFETEYVEGMQALSLPIL